MVSFSLLPTLVWIGVLACTNGAGEGFWAGYDEMAKYRQEPLVVPPPIDSADRTRRHHQNNGQVHRHHRHKSHYHHMPNAEGRGIELSGFSGGNLGIKGGLLIEDPADLSSWEERHHNRIRAKAQKMEEEDKIPERRYMHRQNMIKGHAPGTFDEFDGHTGEFIRSTRIQTSS